jgi:hypothetical protein
MPWLSDQETPSVLNGRQIFNPQLQVDFFLAAMAMLSCFLASLQDASDSTTISRGIGLPASAPGLALPALWAEMRTRPRMASEEADSAFRFSPGIAANSFVPAGLGCLVGAETQPFMAGLVSFVPLGHSNQARRRRGVFAALSEK